MDLTKDDGPAYGLNGTGWEDYLFMNETLDRIQQHNISKPLFLMHAFHSIHTPLNPPDEILEPYRHLWDKTRRAYAGMVSWVDRSVGEIVSALKAKGMWDNTLLLWSSDNGGASHRGGGANNFPLRGGYYNNWEGGIRVSALLAGGALPSAMRGKKMEGFVHEADWWATFCHLAGTQVTYTCTMLRTNLLRTRVCLMMVDVKVDRTRSGRTTTDQCQDSVSVKGLDLCTERTPVKRAYPLRVSTCTSHTTSHTHAPPRPQSPPPPCMPRFVWYVYGYVHVPLSCMSMSLSLAGISDPSDSAAAASDPPLPPVDSLNVWGLLSGTTDVSPRMEWPLTPLGEDAVRAIHGGDAAYMAEGRYVGGEGVRTAGWRGNEGCNVP